MSKKSGAKSGGSKSGSRSAVVKAASKKPAPPKRQGQPAVKKVAGAASKNGARSAKASRHPAIKAKPAKAAVAKSGTGAKSKALTGAASGVATRTMAAQKKPSPTKIEGLPKKMPPRGKIADIVLPPGYRPSEDEPFMSDKHRAYFRKRLLEWKDEILRQTRETLAILHEDSTQHADLADRATSETDRATELRTRDRQRKLIAKIDAAVARIDDGSYGYCEDTGEPIGLKRLDARPIATLSVEAQERHERREKVYREE